MIFNTHYPYIGGVSGGGKPNFSYTGQMAEIDDGAGNWRVKFLTSGTLTSDRKVIIDVFLVGGGGGASFGTESGGGGGGYTKTVKQIELPKDTPINIIIGSGGAGSTYSDVKPKAGGSSAFGSQTVSGGSGATTKNGGAGGSGGGGGDVGGNGGSNGSNGGNAYGGQGQGTTTREFGEANGELYAGGGAGHSKSRPYTYYGGAGGGGSSTASGAGGSGTTNTGGGGGSTGGSQGGNGGSGIVIIRNAR